MITDNVTIRLKKAERLKDERQKDKKPKRWNDKKEGKTERQKKSKTDKEERHRDWKCSEYFHFLFFQYSDVWSSICLCLLKIILQFLLQVIQ